MNRCEIDNLLPVLTFLRDHLPQSLLSYQLLTNVYTKIVTEEDIHPQVFVNHPTEIECVIVLYSEPGSVLHWDLNSILNVAIVCDAEFRKDILLQMLIKCIPWDRKLVFCALNQRHVTPVIEQLIREKQFGDYKIFPHIQYELDRDVFIEKSKILPTEVPPGIVIRPLKPEDAFLIIEAEEYRSSDLYSVAQVQFSIKNLCSMGAYRDGKLIAWRLLQYDGSFDMVYTLPEARRLGLASLLSVRLTAEIFKIQDCVFGYTALNNQKSMGLAAKMGFHNTGIYDWIILEPSHISSKKPTQHLLLLKSSI